MSYYPEGAEAAFARKESAETAFARARERAELDIRIAFAAYFNGDDKALVPRVQGSTGMLTGVMVDGECTDIPVSLESLYRQVLRGTAKPEALQAAIVDRYVADWADEVAELYAGGA